MMNTWNPIDAHRPNSPVFGWQVCPEALVTGRMDVQPRMTTASTASIARKPPSPTDQPPSPLNALERQLGAR